MIEDIQSSKEDHEFVITEEIRFIEPQDEKWNSEFYKILHSVLHNVMSDDFRCPVNDSDDFTTVYKMPTGEHTAAGTSMTTWKKKPSEVILVLEVGPPVPWMKPEDITLDELSQAVYPTEVKDWKTETRPVIGGKHAKDFRVLFADGTVKTYQFGEISVAELVKMCQTEKIFRMRNIRNSGIMRKRLKWIPCIPLFRIFRILKYRNETETRFHLD
jgi:hypothetical protein